MCTHCIRSCGLMHVTAHDVYHHHFLPTSCSLRFLSRSPIPCSCASRVASCPPRLRTCWQARCRRFRLSLWLSGAVSRMRVGASRRAASKATRRYAKMRWRVGGVGDLEVDYDIHLCFIASAACTVLLAAGRKPCHYAPHRHLLASLTAHHALTHWES